MGVYKEVFLLLLRGHQILKDRIWQRYQKKTRNVFMNLGFVEKGKIALDN